MLSKPAQYGRFAHSCLPCFMEGGGCEEPGTTGVCIRAVECSKPSRSVFFSSWSKNIGETLYSRRFHTRTLEPLLRIYIYIYIYIYTYRFEAFERSVITHHAWYMLQPLPLRVRWRCRCRSKGGPFGSNKQEHCTSSLMESQIHFSFALIFSASKTESLFW